jgi:hypothetical protein
MRYDAVLYEDEDTKNVNALIKIIFCSHFVIQDHKQRDPSSSSTSNENII